MGKDESAYQADAEEAFFTNKTRGRVSSTSCLVQNILSYFGFGV